MLSKHSRAAVLPRWLSSAASKCNSYKIDDRPQPSTFVQDEPRHENAFTSDAFLMRCMKRLIPHDSFREMEPDLVRFGDLVRTHLWKIGQQCEAEPPYLKSTTAWGKRVDELVTSGAWKAQKKVAAEEGLIAIAYEKAHGQYSRIYQTAKLMMYSPASGLYSCPLAMTDGAIKTLYTCDQKIPEVKEAIDRLTTRDPERFWTSGQWMTEKRGGSDVSGGTETVATPLEGQPGKYLITGYKWFSSATDSDMSLLLARLRSNPDSLSMFLLKTRDDDNHLNGIQIVKLKNKLGTRQLPTAELILSNSVATLVSPEGRGVSSIANMLTTTRLHNVMSSVAIQRKILSMARDYSTRRVAFGKRIAQHPLHLSTLAQIEVDVRGCTVLLMDLARQQGLEDMNMIDDSDKLLLRLMMPVAKLYTAKKAVANTSEGIECFGGQGYIEDTGIPGFLRDAQVLPIWEGTSNVMALDIMRAMGKSRGEAFKAFNLRVAKALQAAAKSNDSHIIGASQALKGALYGLVDFVAQHQSDSALMEVAGRDFAFSLAHIYICALLIDHALVTHSKTDAFVARQWTSSRDLCPVTTMQKTNSYKLQRDAQLHDLVFEGFDGQSNIIA